ncbi:SAE2-domain-containing protein [Aspergillus eucalypticola CBS 122712]|uniref:SAE2-domain-containing protein n=1 Tax=Aspergillus eucalypticola (strain CBS 122712 / IBT 29274) TaxID=1448314 RepID=A0A317VZH8_ASPEC|nr:SAE2-domain-containing protein [Aspergillus eucalypticola CBS 122712]PWY79766.1 SAE2-domain-containing protein [Aspergillus eucalypticola CBS 122712]
MEALEQFQISLTQAFGDCFKDVYKTLQRELALRDAKVQAAEERVRIADEARKRADAESTALKDEITLLRDELRLGDVGSTEDQVTAQKSLELEATYAPHRAIDRICANRKDSESFDSTEIMAVRDLYAALYTEAQTLMKASGELRRQVKRHKQKLMHWRKSLDRDNFTLVLDGEAVDFQRAKRNSCEEHSRLLTNLSTSIPINSSKSAMHPFLRGVSAPIMHTLRLGVCDESSNADVPREPAAAQSATAPAATIKRKRSASQPPHKICPTLHLNAPNRGNSGSSQPISIKDEGLSSSPLGGPLSSCGATGTQDLDEVGVLVQTPTKRKKYKEIVSERAASPAIEARRKGLSPARSQSFSRRPTVLQSVNGNTSIHRYDQRLGTAAAKGSKARLKYPISAMAEDGEENDVNVATPNQFNTSAFGARSPHPRPGKEGQFAVQRLEGLLEGPVPVKQQLQPKNINEEFTRGCTVQRSPSVGRTLSQTSDNSRGGQTNAESEIKQGSSKLDIQHGFTQATSSSGSEAQRVKENATRIPYRTLPLHRLELTHFRINPNYNQGVNFAFSSVIRTTDERKCAKGCMRPSCCGGKFHAMARLGGLPTNATSNKDREQEERKILEDYLGEEAHILDILSTEDRKSLLQEANARLIANRFGKHRHHHQRSGSPPGYWRTDMPDTQELQRDHEEAREIEREKVRDRYREAMRPGGLWKFADE